jgi:hypothetical protein
LVAVVTDLVGYHAAFVAADVAVLVVVVPVAAVPVAVVPIVVEAAGCCVVFAAAVQALLAAG